MNKIYIVEDEPLIAQTIETVLKKYHFQIVGDADNAEDAFEEISELKPNLVLLDITLEGETDGIDLAKKIDVSLKIPYIFITSLSDPITIQRIKQCNPMGYIVKPFTEQNLLANVTLGIFKKSSIQENETKKTSDDFFVKHQGKIIKIPALEVCYFEAYDNYCFLHTADNKYLITHTLKSVEEKLPKNQFIRIHRSTTINIKHIESIFENTVLINEREIVIGKTYKEELLQKINLL
ncbi:MAG: response regulator [Flavobacterium sp.]|uniref:LytR/AlgR family response regulator transcription factor n=1 Tax=Flavobacterium sp. TaxID=239 RepID=UPI0026196F30|nr:response regulator [Flavobacterium sp.]MDD5149593.1 response regulator [Flavobacterium sp.]